MRAFRTVATVVVGTLSLQPACADGPSEPDIAHAQAGPSDDKADGATELRVRIDGVTTWFRPALTSVMGAGWQEFGIDGRTSRNLSSVFSFVPDDPFGEARTVSARKFHVDLADADASQLLAGLRLRLRIATGDKTVHARLALGAELGGFAGSTKLWIARTLAPVWVGGEIVYRARVETPSGLDTLAVRVGERVVAGVVAEEAGAFRVDFAFDDVAEAALPGVVVAFEGRYRSGATLKKTASLTVRVQSAELTAAKPWEVWPADACRPEVAACVQATPGCDLGDTAACGGARDVSLCVPSACADQPTPPAADPIAVAFVADLREHLAKYYDAMGDALETGAPLAVAQAAVQVANVARVTDPEEDPYGHDLGATIVVRHADVIWPGSDRVWFGAYDAASGRLVEVYVFN